MLGELPGLGFAAAVRREQGQQALVAGGRVRLAGLDGQPVPLLGVGFGDPEAACFQVVGDHRQQDPCQAPGRSPCPGQSDGPAPQSPSQVMVAQTPGHPGHAGQRDRLGELFEGLQGVGGQVGVGAGQDPGLTHQQKQLEGSVAVTLGRYRVGEHRFQQRHRLGRDSGAQLGQRPQLGDIPPKVPGGLVDGLRTVQQDRTRVMSPPSSQAPAAATARWARAASDGLSSAARSSAAAAAASAWWAARRSAGLAPW